MWNRAELKKKGREHFKANYWKSVLVALILAIVLGGGLSIKGTYSANETSVTTEDTADSTGITELDEDNDSIIQINDIEIGGQDATEVIENVVNVLAPYSWILGVLGASVISFGLLTKIFVLNIIEVGSRRYFVRNLEEKAQLKEMAAGFKYNYLNNVKTMFFKDLYTFLWALLFIVPGIIKWYEYRMVPYLIEENPEISTRDALERSKQMMKGNKWDTFVLDLSFIGWRILGALTAGILEVLYVNPYYYSTSAALYQTLSGDAAVDQSNEYYVEMQ